MEIVLIIETIIILLLLGFMLLKKKSGRLIIDEARDSWTIAITEDPEKIKKKKSIKLKIEKTT